MLPVPHSPIYRRGRLLCGNFSGGSQIVNRSLEYHPDPQYFHPNSVGERNSFPNLTSMMPVLASNMDFLVPRSMDPVISGMRPTQLPMRTLHPPRFADPHFVADSRLAANINDPFMPIPHFNTPTDFEGMFHNPLVAPQPSMPPLDFGEMFHDPLVTPQPPTPPPDFRKMFHDPLVAPQPPTPPAAPEAFILPNPEFQYYPCLWLGGPPCDGFAPGKNREMAEHLRVYHHFVGHERDLVPCEWQDCGQFMQRMNVARHIVSRHLLAAANCRFCGRRFCRPDVVARHERTCNVIPSVPSSSRYRT